MRALAGNRSSALAATLRTASRGAVDAAPGVLATLAAACAATFAASLLHAPTMLLALLLGMALNPLLAPRAAFAPGLAFSAQGLLRLGVVLLGARVTLSEVGDLGAANVLLTLGGVVVTLSGGWLIARMIGLRTEHAALSAGAVAICGASAALAIAAVLPRRPECDRNTMQTMVGVTTLSTIAMVLYPAIALGLGLDHRSAGVFLGASIHDVAQAVGAGFMISADTAETATIVKLTRVACLAPAVAALGLMFRDGGASAEPRVPVPLFLIGFAALMLARSAGLIGDSAARLLAGASQWFLVIAVAALGAKTSIRDLLAPGWRPLLALVMQTALLCVFALAGLWLLR